MSETSRSWLLIGVSVVASIALVGAYLGAGGGDYAPAEARDPCRDRPWPEPEGLEELAQQFTLSALDGAACELGVSREALARALATREGREEFMERYDVSAGQLARAVRAGLLRAVDDGEESGALSPLVAGPLRRTLRSIPIERGIELINDARLLLDGAESLLGPVQGILEEFLP